MKTVVSMQELRELEIKPTGLLSEYRKFLERDVRSDLIAKLEIRLEKCPACGQENLQQAFEKWGIRYERCASCHSIFANPRPAERVLETFYSQSDAATYWRESVLPATEEARTEKLYLPRSEWVLDGLAEYGTQSSCGMDYSPCNLRMLEILKQDLAGLETLISSHPQTPVSRGEKSGLVASPGALFAEPPPEVDFITSFDAFDRLARPVEFVASVQKSLKAGGLFFMTATSGSGFDIQLLGPLSPSILPPDRLNLFSIEGLQALFGPSDWELCEISTPGMLDVELVASQFENLQQADRSRFFEYLFLKRGRDCQASLQEFLQQNRLSSFARIIARKK